MAVELATAYVSIAAETSGLARDLQRDLGRAGQRAGDDFSDSFVRGTRDIDRDVSRRLRDTGGDEGEQAGRRFSSGFSERLSGLGDAVGDRLGGAADRISGMAGDSGGAQFLAGFSGQIGSLGAKGGPIGAALGGVGAIGLAAGAVLATAVADGMRQQGERDLIQARLGVNDATMATIGTAAGAAFSNAWGESVNANMEAAQLAIQSGILSGEESAGQMQPVIEGLNVVTDLMGGEMTDTIRAVSALMKNDLVGSSQEAFDVIVRGYQRGGNIGDDLIDTLSEYSNGWKQTGFSAEFAMGLVNQAMENGVDNTDRAGDAIREFGRRMVEEGDTVKEAIGSLGLPVDELFTALSEGGPKGEAAFDQIFDAIRQVEDPLERAAIAQSLLGDTAGDFINSFTNWDPSRAQAAFGAVNDAAKQAADTMSSNPGAAWQSAMNTIKVQADDLKLSLAGAFAPMMTDLATWVSEHKPEIIGFFTDLGVAALSALDSFAGFASGALRAWAGFADGMAQMVGTVTNLLAGAVGLSADFLSIIPGMGEQASELRSVEEGMKNFGNSMFGAGDQARGLADSIDTMRPGLQAARDGIAAGGAAAENSARLMRALGDSVLGIPDGKSIIIKDNSPERRAELEKLGLTVRELPDGTFQVFANTSEGQRIVDDFVRNNDGRNVDVWVTLKQRRAAGGVDPNFVGPTVYDSGLPRNATGGFITGPGTGTSDSILSWLSNGEYVVNAAATRKYRGLLEAINNGTIPAFAAGGYFNADAAISKAKAHDGEPYVYGGLDCSGYLSAVFNAGTGQGVRFVTGSDFASMGWERGYDPDGFSIGTDGGVGVNGHMAGTLYGVNIESDGSNGIQYGRGADGATDFPMVWHWPGASGGDDPTMEDLGSGRAQIDQITGLSPMGGGTSGPGPRAGGTGGGGGGGGSAAGGSGGAAAPSKDVVSVFVTNWPDGTRTVESFTGSGDSAPSGSMTTPDSTMAAQSGEPNPYEERLKQYGEQMAGIGADAALEILGLEGTLLDPNHRFWSAGREIAQAFAQRGTTTAPAPAQSVDNSVTVQAHGLIDQRIVDEIARRVAMVQSRNVIRNSGRPI